MISIFSYGSHCSAQFKHSFYDSELQVGIRNVIGNDFLATSIKTTTLKTKTSTTKTTTLPTEASTTNTTTLTNVTSTTSTTILTNETSITNITTTKTTPSKGMTALPGNEYY